MDVICNMMKLSAKFQLLMFLIFMSVTVHSGENKTPIVQSEYKTLVIGSEQNFPPFATGMTDSTAGGFTVELWKAVAEEAGLKNYIIRVMPFRQILQEYKEGRIDVLINLAISPERKIFADFSVPHVIVNGALFVRENNTDIHSEDDLSGKSIIVLNADLAHDYAKYKGWNEQLVLVDTTAKGLKMLASGKHDVMLVSKLVGMQSIQDIGLTNIKALKTPAGFSQKFAFAVTKGQNNLLSQINEALAITNTNGVYTAIYDKWFGVYEEKEPTLSELIKYTGTIVFIFLAVLGYFYHQRQIERKQAEEKLKLAASVFSHALESIAITDSTGTIIDVNDTFTQSTGYSREEILSKNLDVLHCDKQPPEFYAEMWKNLLEQGYWCGEMWNKHKDGEIYAEMKTISSIRDERNVITHYVALGSDITRMKEHEAKLQVIAHYDTLTNLPNRSLLADRLSQSMRQSQRHNTSLAVVFLDLDNFKYINDTHGHSVGDELLIIVSQRMQGALREGDTLARIGGDEFVAVLIDLAYIVDCEPIIERLLLAASETIHIDDAELHVSTSIGVTIYPEDNVDADQLMRHADQAMYVAKQTGKNRHKFFDTVQDDAVNTQIARLEAIQSALDNHQFLLHYQPKINMRTGSVIGLEALIRWQHPELGLLQPNDFLSVIENNSLGIKVGEWVIDTALTQISVWQKTGLKLPVSTSVNISALQLQQNDFVDSITKLLEAHPDVEPRYLELEILETSALDDVEHVSKVMNSCMALGVNFSLDDFGTGYSSLTYLRRLPAHIIKIDQSFVRDMLHDPDDFAIVEGVIALAKSFKRNVIAEGVETIEHGSALLQMGCELAQGYGIARPMPADDVPLWITTWKPDDSWKL